MNKTDREQLFARLAARIDPKPELHFNTPLDLLVAVVLSAQTTDKAVNAVTAQLWQLCRTPQDYLNLGSERLQQLCRSIGLFRNKTRAILGLCHMILRDFKGQVPQDAESLMRLPGVGRKTANVVLNVAFGHPVIAVDTHVFRVANRTGLAIANTPDRVASLLQQRTPASYLPVAHHLLLLHGRYCCTARQPHCADCPLQPDLCQFFAATARNQSGK